MCCFGLALTAAASIAVRQADQTREGARRARVAEARVAALQRTVDLNLAEIRSLCRFYAASEVVERGEFHAFLEAASQREAIQALAWLPRVENEGRAALERAERGLGLEIREQAVSGAIVRAGRRAEYFPVWYLEPAGSDMATLGIDAATAPDIEGRIEASRDTGITAVSVRHGLQRAPEPRDAFIVLAPIYAQALPPGASVEARRSALQGFVAGVFSIAGLVAESAEGGEDTPCSVRFHATADPMSRVTYSTESGWDRLAERSPDVAPERGEQAGLVEVGDRDYCVVVRPLAEGAGGGPMPASRWVVVVGLVVTGLAAGYARELVGRAAWAEQRVAERTAEIQAANRSLEAEIADRTLAESLLARSEHRFRALAESTSDWVWECDDRGIYTYASPKVRELLGYEAAEVLGRTRWDLMPPGESVQSGADVAAAIVAREPFTRIETPALRRDGQVVVLETSGVPFFDSGGRFLGYRGIDRDVTQRKLDEEQIAHAMAELAHSNAELEQFAHIASHDLQEPLRKIMAFGDRLQSKYSGSLDEAGRDYVHRMRSAAERMQLLIQGLLSYSRVTTRAHLMQRVDLSRIADEVLQDLEVRVEQVHGRVLVQPLPSIDADPTQMRQLLQNLVGNALKFHRKGIDPVVEIGAERAAHPDRADPDESHDTGWWVLSVRDNGIGFDPRRVDRIFGIFQRLHGRDEYDGTGVGLAVCRKIAERHGGRITARSAPGEGATFLVTLPEHQAEAERAPDDGTA